MRRNADNSAVGRVSILEPGAAARGKRINKGWGGRRAMKRAFSPWVSDVDAVTQPDPPQRTRTRSPGAPDGLGWYSGAPLALTFALQLLCFLVIGPSALGQPAQAAAAPDAKSAQELDGVLAVVNKQVILSSDLDLELRAFKLLPIGSRLDATPAMALQRLTTRALIEQQILQEDPQGMAVSPRDLEASLAELRQGLPACKQRDCTSAAGWTAYLATLGLTPARVEEYWAQRMAVLRFIEMRFRSGIRISPEEIQKYYQESFVPKYAKPEDAPPLAKISERIQEILLQQQVNALLTDWLKSLQDQGQVEILDPALKAEIEAAAAQAAAESSTSPTSPTSPAPPPPTTKPAPEKGGGPQ